MTRRELVNLFVSLNQVGNLIGVKFAYGIAKNRNLLRPEIEALNKAMEGSEEFKVFEDLRIKLAQEFAEKDANNQPKIANGQYIITHKGKFDKAFEELKHKHKKTVEQRQKQLKEYERLLDEKVSLNLYKIKLEDIPKEITAAQMDGIFAIISDK